MRRIFVGLGMAAAAIAAAVTLPIPLAEAQRIDPRRPTVLVVGRAPGAATMARVDAQRTGRSPLPLPLGTLRPAWRKATGLTVDQAALLGGDGTLALVSVRGDVSFVDEAGDERAAVKVGAGQVGPAAITSDGTVVFATSAGDAIGVRRDLARPRFATRIGGERNARCAPLALDDGGVVLATATELVVLDAEGNVRARAALPESAAAPLLVAGASLIAVTTSGTVYGWEPGREPIRIGSFGAPVDGGALVTDRNTLLAVTLGNQLAEVDLARGSRTTRATASAGIYLGPPALGAHADGGAITTVLGLTSNRGSIVSIDASGQELVRAPVATFVAALLPDGGAPALVVPPHVGPLVDARGTVAFANTDGKVGVLAADGATETIGELLCPKAGKSGIVGLTPFGRDAFAVTCDGGTLVRIVGSERKNADRDPVRSAEPRPAVEVVPEPPRP